MEYNRLLRFAEISTPPPRYREHLYGKKLSRLKSSINVVLFLKSRKKLSPMMNEKTRCNTLFESLCI